VRAVEFDAFASSYESALSAGLSLTGETSAYYARGRSEWLAERLRELKVGAGAILDFGCGTGTSVPFLSKLPGSRSVHGVDVSQGSLAVARRLHGSRTVTFGSPNGSVASESFDLAFCNGVFHHIAPGERASAVDAVWRALRPGGYFAFWENNPWNPGTRYIMSRVSFDRGAITLTPPESRALLRNGGFALLRTDFLFIFPALLRSLRWLERPLSRLPFGGQYLVLARKVARATRTVA
jgi:SAM-dependent methyltransferase